MAVITALGGNAPAQAAKAATTQIPIVFVSGGDPVSGGLVASFNRPGGNVTGVVWNATVLVPKRLELLRGLAGNPGVIGALVNPGYPDHDLQLRELKEAAATIRQEIIIAHAATAHDIDTAFASLVQKGAGALIVANDPFFNAQRQELVVLAARHAIPAIYEWREFAAVGGLMSYGTIISDAYRQAGVYTGRILKGEKPADLPVVQPTKFELVINLKTAKALGLQIPDKLLATADEVIE
jgi:putative ABC transport system substrate-binding protein